MFAVEKNKTLDYSFSKFKDTYFRDRMLEMMKESDFGIIDMRIEEKLLPMEEGLKTVPPELMPIFTQKNGMFAMRKLSTFHKKNGKVGATVMLDFFQESDGTQQMFALSGPFVDVLKDGKTLFIDELDAHLHPFLLRYILAIFNNKEKNPKNAQLLFTTHDVGLLDNKILRRDQIWFAEKDKNETSNYFSLAEISEREGVNFAKRYFEGRYGALPYISSLEGIENEL